MVAVMVKMVRKEWLWPTVTAFAVVMACGHSARDFGSAAEAGMSGVAPTSGASSDDNGGSAAGGNGTSEAGASPDDSAPGGNGMTGAAGADHGGAAGHAAGPVTVRVLDLADHHLVSGASVLLHDADGALISETLTGKTGVVQVDLTDGQSVSAALVKDYVLDNVARQARMISSAFDVPPGATVELLVSDPAVKSTTTVPKTIEVTVTVNTSIPNAETYRLIQLSCAPAYGGSSSTYVFKNYKGCPGETTYNAYGLIKVAGKLHAFGATYFVPFTGSTNEIVLNATNTDLSSYELDAEGVPPGSQYISFSAAIARDQADPFSYPDFNNSTLVQLPNAGLTLGASLPTGNFKRYGSHGQLRLSDSPFYLDSWFRRASATLPAKQSWSPILDIAVFEPTFKVDADDAQRPKLSWDLAAQGKLGDAVEQFVSWGPVPFDAKTQTNWNVWVPAVRAGSVQLPELPEHLAAVQPQAGDIFNTTANNVDLLEVDDYSGYLARHVELGLENANWAQLGDYH